MRIFKSVGNFFLGVIDLFKCLYWYRWRKSVVLDRCKNDTRSIHINNMITLGNTHGKDSLMFFLYAKLTHTLHNIKKSNTDNWYIIEYYLLDLLHNKGCFSSLQYLLGCYVFDKSKLLINLYHTNSESYSVYCDIYSDFAKVYVDGHDEFTEKIKFNPDNLVLFLKDIIKADDKIKSSISAIDPTDPARSPYANIGLLCDAITLQPEDLLNLNDRVKMLISGKAEIYHNVWKLRKLLWDYITYNFYNYDYDGDDKYKKFAIEKKAKYMRLVELLYEMPDWTIYDLG